MNIKDFINSIPKMWLGPIAVVLGIIYFVVQENPITICEIQYDIFKKENEKYLFGVKRKNVTIPPKVTEDVNKCMVANSPGGCYDWTEGLKLSLHSLRNLPDQCGHKLNGSTLGGSTVKTLLEKSVWLYSQISWNEAIIARAGLYNWLDTDDVANFCRLRNQYTRLLGNEKWVILQASLLKSLSTEKKMEEKSAWTRTILSHKCP